MTHDPGINAPDSADKNRNRHEDPDETESSASILGNNIEPAGIRPELGKTHAVPQVRQKRLSHSFIRVVSVWAMSARSRSSFRSDNSSTPTLTRTRLSVTPSSARRLAGTDA